MQEVERGAARPPGRSARRRDGCALTAATTRRAATMSAARPRVAAPAGVAGRARRPPRARSAGARFARWAALASRKVSHPDDGRDAGEATRRRPPSSGGDGLPGGVDPLDRAAQELEARGIELVDSTRAGAPGARTASPARGPSPRATAARCPRRDPRGPARPPCARPPTRSRPPSRPRAGAPRRCSRRRAATRRPGPPSSPAAGPRPRGRATCSPGPRASRPRARRRRRRPAPRRRGRSWWRPGRSGSARAGRAAPRAARPRLDPLWERLDDPLGVEGRVGARALGEQHPHQRPGALVLGRGGERGLGDLVGREAQLGGPAQRLRDDPGQRVGAPPDRRPVDDAGARPVAADDVAGVRQPPVDGTHGVGVDAQGGAELAHRRQPRAGLQAARLDLVGQLPVDLGGDRDVGAALDVELVAARGRTRLRAVGGAHGPGALARHADDLRMPRSARGGGCPTSLSARR